MSTATGKKVLNMPMIVTAVMDYCWMYGFAAFLIYYMGGDKFQPWHSGLAIFLLFQVDTARDYLYWLIFPHYFAEAKIKFKFFEAEGLLFDYVKITVFFVFNAWFVAYVDMFHFDLNGLNTVLLVSYEYWSMSILKDVTMMKFVHRWMHNPKNYWLHKQHHKAAANAQNITTYYFDLLDVVIENLIGVLIMLGINAYLFGAPSIHVLSFMFLVWTDANLHSMNPWTVCTFNPVIDYMCKFNVQHALHHYIQNDHYTLIPWHHLVSSASRDADVAKYNKGLKTNISFSLYVDENPKTQLAEHARAHAA